MGFLENLLILDLYICGFIAFGFIATGIAWIAEKTGLAHWARGWLWYFGIIDDCPDIEQQ